MKVEQDPKLSSGASLDYHQRHERGRAARRLVPRGSHAEWAPTSDRPDPVELLEAQARDRIPELLPIRYARMMASPFAFLRGSAIVMANDLASTPKSGIQAQLCGDAHLLNFGAYASPERTLLFDLNDFDETLPGPWEWDVKRLAVSFVVAGRDNGFDAADCREAARASVASYRQRMAEFSEMGELGVWYSRIGEEEVRGLLTEARAGKKTTKKLSKNVRKARGRDSLQALSKLTRVVDGRRIINDDPPLLVRIPEGDELRGQVYAILESYKRTLQEDRRHLLERYDFVDAARKVVGVGSVGTRVYVVLLEGRDRDDPLFLQVKEAGASVLEGHVEYRHLRTPRTPRRGRAKADAGGQRHLPRLVSRHGRPRLLLAAVEGHERFGEGREHVARRAGPLRRPLRVGTCPGARPLRRPGADRRLPRQERPLRPLGRRLRRGLRRPERTGSRGPLRRRGVG